MADEKTVNDLVTIIANPAFERFGKVVDSAKHLEQTEKDELKQLHTKLTDMGQNPSGRKNEAENALKLLKKLYKKTDTLKDKAGRTMSSIFNAATNKPNSDDDSEEYKKQLARNEIKLIIQILKVGFLMIITQQTNLAVCGEYTSRIAGKIDSRKALATTVSDVCKKYNSNLSIPDPMSNQILKVCEDFVPPERERKSFMSGMSKMLGQSKKQQDEDDSSDQPLAPGSPGDGDGRRSFRSKIFGSRRRGGGHRTRHRTPTRRRHPRKTARTRRR